MSAFPNHSMVALMKSSLDHLPQKQQDELARARTILLDEFEAALKAGGGGTQDWRGPARS